MVIPLWVIVNRSMDHGGILRLQETFRVSIWKQTDSECVHSCEHSERLAESFRAGAQIALFSGAAGIAHLLSSLTMMPISPGHFRILANCELVRQTSPKSEIYVVYCFAGSMRRKSIPAASSATSTLATILSTLRSIISTVPGSEPTPSTETNA